MLLCLEAKHVNFRIVSLFRPKTDISGTKKTSFKAYFQKGLLSDQGLIKRTYLTKPAKLKDYSIDVDSGNFGKSLTLALSPLPLPLPTPCMAPSPLITSTLLLHLLLLSPLVLPPPALPHQPLWDKHSGDQKTGSPLLLCTYNHNTIYNIRYIIHLKYVE